MKRYAKSLFVFRRDLRVDDNTALIDALKKSESVLTWFVLDPRQAEKHDYLSLPAFDFMLSSLEELDADLRLRGGALGVSKGKVEEILDELLPGMGVDAVFMNRDYTPFSRKRDEDIETVCRSRGIALVSHGDALLNEPEDVRKNDGGPYTVFSPFWKKSSAVQPGPPAQCRMKNFAAVDTNASEALTGAKPHALERPFLRGGRKEGLALLSRLSELKGNENFRDEPAVRTTGLSAHLKFGTVSVREVYRGISEALGSSSPFLRQLYWRDFFSHISWHFPHVFTGAFHRKLDALEWKYDEESFGRWCGGRTGFPVVDAAMRELNATGYMHNRARLIAASFLTKDLHLSWREGEKYFAQRLIDYDPAVNNGNWQWSASTGCDAQPYFRIFNPWIQQKKFDRDCTYIKTWVPELSGLSPVQIHGLEKKAPESLNYPRPMVNHAEASLEAKAMFEGAL